MNNSFEQMPFNPHDEKFKKTADLPKEEQANFVDYKNGFIGKQAAEDFEKAGEDADFDNSWRRTFADKFFRRNKLSAVEVLRDNHECAVRTTIGRIKDGRNVTEETKKEYGIDMPDTSPEYKEEILNLLKEYDNIWPELVVVVKKIEDLKESFATSGGGMPWGGSSSAPTPEQEMQLRALQIQEGGIQSRLRVIREKIEKLHDQLT